MGNVTIFWRKTVTTSVPPNDYLSVDEYYSRRFNASTGSWSDPSVSPISNNPPTNLYNPIPWTTYIDPQGRITAIWSHGDNYYSNWFN